MSTKSNSHEHDHHVTPPTTLFATLGALALLMGLTILVYEVDFGHILSRGNSALGSYINNFIALTIALVKATLVVQIFMGVKWGSKLVKMWAMTGFVWVTLMGITFGDYTSRTWENNRGWNPGDTDLAVLPSSASEVVKARQEELHKEHLEKFPEAAEKEAAEAKEAEKH